MSDSFTAHPDEPARPKRLWTGGTLDLRAAATYPKKQVPGLALFAIVGTMCMLGLWKVARINQKRNRNKQELEVARINLLPLLQAEADRRYVRQRKQQVEEEAKIMEGVDGWVVGESVYKTRWMPPTSVDPAHRL